MREEANATIVENGSSAANVPTSRLTFQERLGAQAVTRKLGHDLNQMINWPRATLPGSGIVLRQGRSRRPALGAPGVGAYMPSPSGHERARPATTAWPTTSAQYNRDFFFDAADRYAMLQKAMAAAGSAETKAVAYSSQA